MYRFSSRKLRKRILILIKAIDEKLSSLQKLAQDMNSNFVSKINESDQQHFNNVKIVDKKIVEVHEKLGKFVIKQTKELKDQPKQA